MFIIGSYFAPEYFMNGIVDEKTDVFSYGVLVLEIITGRQALDDSQKSLVLWVSYDQLNYCISYDLVILSQLRKFS